MKHSKYFKVNPDDDNPKFEALFDQMVKCADMGDKSAYEVYYDSATNYFYLVYDTDRGWIIEEVRPNCSSHDDMLEAYEDIISPKLPNALDEKTLAEKFLARIRGKYYRIRDLGSKSDIETDPDKRDTLHIRIAEHRALLKLDVDSTNEFFLNHYQIVYNKAKKDYELQPK